MDGFVDISNVKRRQNKLSFKRETTAPKPTTPTYMLNNKPITYDNRTMLYYKTLRQNHLDPILNMEVDEKMAFKFKDQWDAYTGDRICEDPFGALYFHPVSLIYNFYVHRLDGLWKDAVDTNEGYFEGYYDMLVGSGEELEVVGRAKYTELYLFRLPIIDCYLTADHNKSFITMGPKLSDAEIENLEKLSQLPEVQNEYWNSFQMKIPSIKKMKYLYDSAISKTVTIPPDVAYRVQYNVPQHFFVDSLRMM